MQTPGSSCFFCKRSRSGLNYSLYSGHFRAVNYLLLIRSKLKQYLTKQNSDNDETIFSRKITLSQKNFVLYTLLFGEITFEDWWHLFKLCFIIYKTLNVCPILIHECDSTIIEYVHVHECVSKPNLVDKQLASFGADCRNS